MKGKGKGKEMHDRDCPLQFPDFNLVDMTRLCPRMSSVLGRTEDEGVGLEDMDVIQLELETLLSSVTKRMHLLQGEMQVLINHDKKDKRSSGKVQPEPPAKRGKPIEDKPMKKFKDNAYKSNHSPVPIPRPGKNKNLQVKVPEHDMTDGADVSRQVPKNDAPNRFWNSVDPYCADITQDDVKFLEDLISQHEDNADYLKIPALGKHYSLKWAQEDLLEEQKEGNKPVEKKKGVTNGINHNSDSEKLIKKAERECDSDDNVQYGALTQRLVSCLIEENLMTSLDDIMNDPSHKDSSEGNGSKNSIIKPLSASNASALEKRIRKELEEQGLLDMEDLPNSNADDDDDDEILVELKRCQSELKTVSAHNLVQTKNLLKHAKDAIHKQELRQKLQIADTEVKEMYRKLQSIKQKKKIPTKKEKDQAWRAIKERSDVIKLLDSK